MINTEKTGYPSIDKPWLKYYKDTEKEIGIDLNTKATVWDVIEKKLEEYSDVPAIEYFGRVISRFEFRNMVYCWASIFKNMGINENEVVAVYGCLTPDVAAMTFALNLLGAVPYFLKLAISPEALEEECSEARFAVVFAGMWDKVSSEFQKEKYKKVILYRITDGMKQPQKLLVSLRKKQKIRDSHIISVKKAKQLYMGEISPSKLKVDFVAGRRAFITSSSGTTVGGIVKGTVATNEATIAQLYMATTSGTLCSKGDKVLNNLPPTAATSLNILLFLALFRGAYIVIDPRVTKDDFYNQLIKHKPNFVLTTGSFWETFFIRVDKEIQLGKQFDFSHLKGWMVGGEGSDPKKYKKWNEILLTNGAPHMMMSGYGCSELFSSISCDTLAVMTNQDNTLPVMGVGIPFYGLTVGVFDSNGNELPYNMRGELWIHSKSAMQGYYNKQELTKEILIDEWIHTGDIAQISEEGHIFIWGRVKDCTITENGEIVYNFDVSRLIKESSYIGDAIVLPMKKEDGIIYLSVHLEWSDDLTEELKHKEIERIDAQLKEFLPNTIRIYGYAEYEILPFSPTTLKRDKNGMAMKTDGFIIV